MEEIKLKEKQKILMNILKKFKKTCSENNLRYFLGYGTLLGAVRESKMIPWDDDIDVLMPREDYMKLMEIFPEDSNYKLLSIYHTEDYYYPFAKIVDKSTVLREHRFVEMKDLGVYIDIFPIDGLPKKNRFFSIQMFILKEMLKLSYIKNVRSSTKLRVILKAILYPIPKIIGYKRLVNIVDKKARTYKCNLEELAVTVDYVPISKNKIQKHQLEGQEITFEEEVYKIPKNPEITLELLYGKNYMTPISKKEEIQTDITCYKKGEKK